ncbi:MAG TPA: SPOR domain-containing protein, partial [Flavobacteriales bacterium]|nr:SPOR domain-containing protein [Flavobacteriales bacterium]
YLSMRDFKTVKSNDTIYYVVGDYLSAEEAKVRQNEIEELGISTEGVAQSSTKNTREGTQTTITKIPDDKLPKNTNTTQPHDKDVTFRVQVGAFTKPVSQEVFKDVPGLLVVKGPDGITRYYSGSYKTFGEAAEHKLKLDMQGYSGAFVVAYKEGERKNLEEVGATLSEGTKSSELNIDEKTDINKPVVDAGLVKYKIEVGRYKNDIPTEVLDMFLDLGKVLPRRAENGDVVYLYGEFSTIKEAEAALKAAQNAGLKKALIIGDFNGKIISAEEAKSLLRQ